MLFKYCLFIIFFYLYIYNIYIHIYCFRISPSFLTTARHRREKGKMEYLRRSFGVVPIMFFLVRWANLDPVDYMLDVFSIMQVQPYLGGGVETMCWTPSPPGVVKKGPENHPDPIDQSPPAPHGRPFPAAPTERRPLTTPPHGRPSSFH